jgi:ureidoacrylate peracid hydrolase
VTDPRSALLVVDLQNVFVRPSREVLRACGELPGVARAVTQTVRLRERARELGLPVIYTRHVFRPGLRDAPVEVRGAVRARALERGSPGVDIVAELEPDQDEVVVDKNRHDAFFGTDLEARLRDLGVGTLLVAGVVTHLCVETTVRSAVQRDLGVRVASDCTSAPNPAHARSLAAMAAAFARVGRWETLLTARLTA